MYYDYKETHMYASAHPHRDNPFAWAMGPRGGRGGRGHHRGRGGPFGPWGPGFGGRGGPRARRGDVRAALLVLLAEEPRNGYGLMQEIESRSEGVWRPSPGSVYPALQQLEDEGLIRAEERDGSRVFTLTDEGSKHVEENDLGAPWEAVRDDMGSGLHELRGLLMQVGTAAWQVAQAGTEAQVAEARRILGETRRALYRILAEDGEETKDSDAQ
jgi:DNA-binding PadR family transcriptional regulator